MRGLSPVAASGGHSSSRCAGLSLSRPLVAEHRLHTRRLSSCGSRAQLLHGMWDPPRPGLEPASPALAGRFSTTAPPGKPRCGPFLKSLLNLLQYCFCSVFWFFGCEACGNLSSPTRDRTHTPCIGRRSLNHWAAREVWPTNVF